MIDQKHTPCPSTTKEAAPMPPKSLPGGGPGSDANPSHVAAGSVRPLRPSPSPRSISPKTAARIDVLLGDLFDVEVPDALGETFEYLGHRFDDLSPVGLELAREWADQ